MGAPARRLRKCVLGHGNWRRTVCVQLVWVDLVGFRVSVGITLFGYGPASYLSFLLI